jgi:hypothetical protein
MNRVGLVLGVSVVMAAMVVLIAGSVLANDTQPEQTYVDKVDAKQYFALPGSAAYFRGMAEDIEGDGDPGLTAEVDARITYSGTPGPGVETRLTGGTWILCSKFTAPPRDPMTGALIEPVCPTESTIALQGTVRDGGTAVWDTKGGTALVPTGLSSPPCIPVYAGKAKVEAVFDIAPGGTVNGVKVTEQGIGQFKGKLDHKPFLNYKCPGDRPGLYPATLTGTLELKF